MGMMDRVRLKVTYSGSVQGVGFRYTVKSLVSGYDVVGTIRNLPDGRVELIAEGERVELEAFRVGIRESGLESLIRGEDAVWTSASGEFKGFAIVG